MAQALRRVGHEEVGIDPVLDAQSPAGRASPFGRVEGKHPPREPEPVGRRAEPGEEEPKVIVDLGQRPDRGAGTSRRDPLADRHRGREAADEADLGPAELAHELAGVGGEGFEIPTLRFAEDDVEDERGLSRPGHAGDDGHPAVRDVDVDVAEVVLGSVADEDRAHGRRSALT